MDTEALHRRRGSQTERSDVKVRPRNESRVPGSASERPLRVIKDRVGEIHNEEEREGHKKSVPAYVQHRAHSLWPGSGWLGTSGSGVWLGWGPRICPSSCFALDRERVVEKDEAARVRQTIGRTGIHVRIWGEQHVCLVELTDAR